RPHPGRRPVRLSDAWGNKAPPALPPAASGPRRRPREPSGTRPARQGPGGTLPRDRWTSSLLAARLTVTRVRDRFRHSDLFGWLGLASSEPDERHDQRAEEQCTAADAAGDRTRYATGLRDRDGLG